MRAPSVCSTPGCGGEAPRGGKCGRCRTEAQRRRSRQRPRGGPGLPRDWKRRREAQLRREPHCECEDCLAAFPRGEFPREARPRATDVHHDRGREAGGTSETENLKSYAHGHHSRQTARQQPGGWNAFQRRDKLRGPAVP